MKQTQKSWYEDSKDIEEYSIIHASLTNKILDLENELKIEKETSHFIQSQLDIANAKLLEEKEKNKDKIKTRKKEYEKLLSSCNRAKDIDRIKALNERILFCDELLEE